MRRRREADESDRDPHVRRERREDNRHDAQRADKHRGLPPAVRRPAALDECGGEPAAADASNVGGDVDDDDGDAQFRETDAVVLVQKFGEPVEVEPPDGVGQKFSYGEGPRLPMWEQTLPGHPCRRLRRVALDVREFFRGEARVLFGAAVDREPEEEPDEAERAGGDESALPSVVRDNPRDGQRDDYRAEGRACVEDARGERARPPPGPLRHRLDRRREVAALAQTKREARHAEPEGGARERVSHRREAPDDYRQREALARAEPVHHATDDEKAYGVGCLKGRDYPAVLGLVPPD